MDQEKRSRGKRILLIVISIIAVLTAAFGIRTGYKIYELLSSDEFKEFEAKQQRLGEEIVWYLDEDLLSVNIYDPGSAEWASVENACTEDLQSETADFDGYHFITAAGHDEGEGFFVMSKTEEGAGKPSQYAVFRFEIKEHKITAVLDAELVDRIEDCDFR